MVTKIYSMELMVLDHEDRFQEDIVSGIENCKYIHPTVLNVQVREVSEEFERNMISKETFRELFSEGVVEAREEYDRALDRDIDFG